MSQFVLVSYDIADDRRRLKIMKTLEGFGTRVQYSVFECRLKIGELKELRTRLHRLSARTDNIRFYFISEDDISRILIIGNGQVTPDSVFYLH